MSHKVLFLINSYRQKSETFISDQIDFYRKHSQVQVWSRYGEEMPSENVTSFKFPKFKERSLFVIKNIYFFKLTDFLKIIKRIDNIRYYFNLEVLYYVLKLRKLRLENRFEIVYAHFGSNGKLAEELIYFQVLQAEKIFTHFHGLDLLKSKYSNHYYKYLFKKSTAIICGSKYAFAQLEDLGNKNPNTVIIPCGVNQNLFTDLKSTPDTSKNIMRIISVGRFIEFKGMERFITLAKKLLNQGFVEFEFELVGAGPEFNKVNEKVRENGLDACVILTGALSHMEVSKKMSQADIFVYLGITDKDGREETQGVVILEAQYSGLAVLATRVGGVHEYIREGISGYVFNKDDLAGIAARIIQLQSDKNRLKEMGKQAHTYVSENLTQEVLLQRNFNYITTQ